MCESVKLLINWPEPRIFFWLKALISQYDRNLVINVKNLSLSQSKILVSGLLGVPASVHLTADISITEEGVKILQQYRYSQDPASVQV